MELLTEQNAFLKINSLIGTVIDINKRLPDQVFKAQISNYRFIDFDDIFSETFFERVKNFISRTGGTEFFLSVLEPDPQGYFFHGG